MTSPLRAARRTSSLRRSASAVVDALENRTLLAVLGSLRAQESAFVGVDVDVLDTGSAIDVEAGTITFQKLSGTFPVPGNGRIETYCLELDQPLEGIIDFNVVTLDSAPVPGDNNRGVFSAQQISLLRELWGRFESKVDTAAEAAAFQIAIWEIAKDSGLDVAAGSFQVTGATSAAIKFQAQAWLASLNGAGPKADLLAASSITAQDVIFQNPNPAPPPPPPTINKGSISGTKFLDKTGNGLTKDDRPLKGVTIQLYSDLNGNRVFDASDGAARATTTTDSSGNYRFSNLAAGRYIVKEVLTAGYTRTGPLFSDAIAVSLSTNTSLSTGNNFANFFNDCPPNDIDKLFFIVNGKTKVTTLANNVKAGDKVTVVFHTNSSHAHQYSLVSYTSPTSDINVQTLHLQRVYQVDSGYFKAGWHYLTVKTPKAHFQLDFVCGPVIDRFGPAGSNITYTRQGRLIASVHAPLTSKPDNHWKGGWWCKFDQHDHDDEKDHDKKDWDKDHDEKDRDDHDKKHWDKDQDRDKDHDDDDDDRKDHHLKEKHDDRKAGGKRD